MNEWIFLLDIAICPLLAHHLLQAFNLHLSSAANMHSAFARNNQVSLQVKTSPRDWSCCDIWPTGQDLDPYGMFYIATQMFWCNCLGNWLLIVEEIDFFPCNWWKRFLRSSSFSLKQQIVHMLGWNEHVSSCATVYFHRCTCFTQVFFDASMFVQDS